MSIRSYLLILSGIILFPILVFLIFLFFQLEGSDRAKLEDQTLREAHAVASAIEPVIVDMMTTTKLLSSAPELASGNLAALHERTKLAFGMSDTFVILVDSQGNQLLNTRVPFGEKLGKTSNPGALDEALKTGEAVVSDVFIGRTSERWVFNVIQPLPKSNASNTKAVIATKNAETLQVAFEDRFLPRDWYAAVVDGSGNLVVTNDPTSFAAGMPLAPLDDAKVLTQEGLEWGEFGEPDSILGYARINHTDWTAFVWGPAKSAQSSVFTNWPMLLGGGLVTLALASVAALFAAGRIRQAIGGIAIMAEQIGAGATPPAPRSAIREFDLIAQTLERTASQRKEAEDHVKFVMRELAHRTKNLMTVMLATIRQTARHSETVQELQKALEGRVMSLGSSIDLLTAKDKIAVSLRELLEKQLASFDGHSKRFAVTGTDVFLKPDAVQHLGMAFHELATNAVKYGALSTSGGRVQISWTIADGDDGSTDIEISWQETGGPPPRPSDKKGFGSQVTEGHMAAVFQASIKRSFEPTGFRWSLRAPLRGFVSEDDTPLPSPADDNSAISARSRHKGNVVA